MRWFSPGLSPMSSHRHDVLLRLWQRLEEAQVSDLARSHVTWSHLTTCHCRTAEDLTATSRRLARYERLLSEIMPLVSSEVRTLIEEARDNVSS
jgi:hypothetical protein